MKKKRDVSSLATKLLGILWLLFIGVFIAYLVVGTNFFKTTVDKGPLQGEVWVVVLIGDMLGGMFAFLLFAIFLTIGLFRKKSSETSAKKTPVKIKVRNFFLFFIFLAVLPIVLLIRIWQPLKVLKLRQLLRNNPPKKTVWELFKKVGISIPIAGILLPVYLLGYFSVGILTAEQLGLITQNVFISGTGSMYPTFPKGEGKDPKELSQQLVDTPGMFPYPNGIVIAGKRYFGHEIQRGDIVVVEDDKTRKITQEMYNDPSGWVKRVVAIAGDTLELRDGIVYLNGEPQKEPYVARARSTFGESFLQECQQVTVPDNSVFVMGDNRTGSGDSREVGFFSISAINHVLPWDVQEKELTQNWHDTTNDLAESARFKLDIDQYLAALNAKREEAGAKPLKYRDKLETSAYKRGEIMLQYDDFSFEATRSGYTMEKSMRDAGYSNIIWGEAPTPGYLEANELIEYQFEFPESKKFVLDKRYQDIGIAEVQGEINGCPAHVIVQQFAGYVPPHYKADDIQFWENSVNTLRDIQGSWNNLKNSGAFYEQNKEKVDRINQIIDQRINGITDIVGTMRANKWFTASQRAYAESGDLNLYNEQESLATYLNGH